jgi:hypothetical protein
MAARARWISGACLALIAMAIVDQIVETFTEWIENPWIGVSLGFISAAALGLDAWVVGVRRAKDEGPSIRNLAPGGWAMFGAMLWVLAVPAYFFARRKARRVLPTIAVAHEAGTYREATVTRAIEGNVARATWRDGVAIVVVAAIGAIAATGVR